MNVSDLRGILTYIPQFRDKLFVVSIDGAIVSHDNFANLLLDLAVLRSLRIRLIVVHGIGHQLAEMAQEGAAISDLHGTGVTDAPTLAAALTAANRTTHEIMEGLSSSDLRAVYANAVIAHPFGIVGGVDRQFTGRVERVDSEFLNELLDREVVPVLPPLGFDGEGRTFRVNSDGVAQAVAESMRAAKLIYLTPEPGLFRGSALISQMAVAEAEEYLKKSGAEIPPTLISKVEHAVRACKSGAVSRAHLIDGRLDEALLNEIFSKGGVGTMIYANEYTAIRPALKKDVRQILSLIKESVEAEELVKRTRTAILNQLSDYYVFEIDRSIVACVALHVSPDGKAELACLHVSRHHENQGIGRKLIHFVQERAREKGVRQLFALSTRTFNFFQQKGGFQEVGPDFLPADRRERYEQSGRKSKVLVKELLS